LSARIMLLVPKEYNNYSENTVVVKQISNTSNLTTNITKRLNTHYSVLNLRSRTGLSSGSPSSGPHARKRVSSLLYPPTSRSYHSVHRLGYIHLHPRWDEKALKPPFICVFLSRTLSVHMSMGSRCSLASLEQRLGRFLAPLGG
jgi:hypothetical protein